jgi:hypothetical protein
MRNWPPISLTNTVLYVRRAEKQVIPLIKETKLPPGVALLLLAQYSQIHATGDSRLTIESGMVAANNVLALWKAGHYTPGADYPYTLEETLEDIRGGLKAKHDYTEFFQPFIPQEEDAPLGLHQVAAGLVKHPETHLWQIWLITEGPCHQIAAYRDVVKAQQELGELIALVRKGEAFDNLSALGDDAPKQIPADMMQYLIEHLDLYTINI